MQGRIVINPQVLSDERDALAVAYNEAYRAVMEMQNFVPQAEPTQEQLQFFADTAYANDPLMMKRTIVARIATYDSSVPNPTPEQYMDTVNMLQMVMDAGVIQTPEEEEIVSSTLEDMKQSANAPAPMAPTPEEPVEAMAPDMTGEMPVDALPPDANAAGEQLPPELMAMLGGVPASEGIPVRSADGAGNVDDGQFISALAAEPLHYLRTDYPDFDWDTSKYDSWPTEQKTIFESRLKELNSVLQQDIERDKEEAWKKHLDSVDKANTAVLVLNDYAKLRRDNGSWTEEQWNNYNSLPSDRYARTEFLNQNGGLSTADVIQTLTGHSPFRFSIDGRPVETEDDVNALYNSIRKTRAANVLVGSRVGDPPVNEDLVSKLTGTGVALMPYQPSEDQPGTTNTPPAASANGTVKEPTVAPLAPASTDPVRFTVYNYNSDGIGSITSDDTNSVTRVVGDQPGIAMSREETERLRSLYGDDWTKVVARDWRKRQKKYSNDVQAAREQVANTFRTFTKGLKKGASSGSTLDLGLGGGSAGSEADTINANVAAWALDKTDQQILSALNDAARAKAINAANDLYTGTQQQGWMDTTITALEAALKQRGDTLRSKLEERRVTDANDTKALRERAANVGFTSEALDNLNDLTGITSAEAFDQRQEARKNLQAKVTAREEELMKDKDAELKKYQANVTAYNEGATANISTLKSGYDKLMASNALTDEQKAEVTRNYEAATSMAEKIEDFGALDANNNIVKDGKMRLVDLGKTSAEYNKKLEQRKKDAETATAWLQTEIESLAETDTTPQQTQQGQYNADRLAATDRFNQEMTGPKIHALLTGQNQMREYIDSHSRSLGEAAALYEAAKAKAGDTSLPLYKGLDDDAERYMENAYEYFNNYADRLGYSDWNDTFASDSSDAAALEFAKHLNDKERVTFLKFAAASELIAAHNWGKTSGGRRRAVEIIANYIMSQAAGK